MPFKAIVTASSLCIGKQRGPVCEDNAVCYQPLLGCSWGRRLRNKATGPSQPHALWTLLIIPTRVIGGGRGTLDSQLTAFSSGKTGRSPQEWPTGCMLVFQASQIAKMPLSPPSPLLLLAFRGPPQVRAEKNHRHHLSKHIGHLLQLPASPRGTWPGLPDSGSRQQLPGQVTLQAGASTERPQRTRHRIMSELTQ